MTSLRLGYCVCPTMAIERTSQSLRDSDKTNVRGKKHLLVLWQHRWYLVGVALVVGILTYGAMWFVPEEFEAKAAIYVSRMEIFDIPPINPNSVVSLAKNPELLRAVYDEYVTKYGTKPGDFEKFVKQFDVKAEVLQDTTVKKEISPVLELKVRFRGREQTKFLADSWVRNLVKKYGNISLQEAKLRAEAMAKQQDSLEASLRRLDQQRAELEGRLARDRKTYAELLDVLAPSDLPEAREPRNVAIDRNASNLQVTINQPLPKPEGMLARYARIQLELERARAGLATDSTVSVSQLMKEEQVLSATIARIQDNLQFAQKAMSETQRELASVLRLQEMKMAELHQLHRALDIYHAVAAAEVSWNGEGLPVGSDMRAVSQPVMPELRVWPKRTFLAAGAAVAGMIFYALGLLALSLIHI
ncbi:MAG: hypothetical protein N2Z21_01255, partial [Candidatus Sumerlaeaceae bacterium]|nr:hypothetical protein [Candidatus Sumerlaeaceae bacterium]